MKTEKDGVEQLDADEIMKTLEQQRIKFRSGKKLTKLDMAIYQAIPDAYAKEFWLETK